MNTNIYKCFLLLCVTTASTKQSRWSLGLLRPNVDVLSMATKGINIHTRVMNSSGPCSSAASVAGVWGMKGLFMSITQALRSTGSYEEIYSSMILLYSRTDTIILQKNIPAWATLKLVCLCNSALDETGIVKRWSKTLVSSRNKQKCNRNLHNSNVH